MVKQEWVKVAECIWRRGDRYKVRVRLGDGQVFVRTFGSLGEARAARDKARDDSRAGRTVMNAKTSKVTVAELAEAYLAGSAPNWSQRTIDLHASEWRSLAPTFGRRRVVELRPSHVSDWLAKVSAEKAANTVTGQLGLLRSILDRGAADLGIPNVARLVKRPRGKGARQAKRRTAYTPEQMAAVVAAAQPRYRIAVLLGLGLGLRSGELRGLTLDRVDTRTGRVLIDRQLLRIGAGEDFPAEDRLDEYPSHGFGPPKTDSSVGVVLADRELLREIAEHVETFGTGPRGLIVTGHRGQPLDSSQWSREMRRISAVSGVELRGHDLRHTRGSWALSVPGTTIVDVALDLRHSPAMAVRTYLHAEEPADASRSAAMMARLNAGVARKPRARGHLRAV